MSDVRQPWNDLIQEGIRGVREVDASSPFRRYYGTDGDGHPQIAFLTSDEPARPPISEVVHVFVGRRETDGMWTLTLTLLDARLTSVFLQLGADLFRRTETAAGPEEGLERILVGLDEWRRVLSPVVPRRLSEEELRGLFAELWFATCMLASGTDATEVMRAWVGPFGSPQDFRLGAVTHEVKSIRPHATGVRISSAGQLAAGAGRLELHVLTVADSPRSSTGTTLVELVNEFMKACVSAGGQSSDVADKVGLLGVDLQDEYYASRWFEVLEHRSYLVARDFPAITSADVPSGVADVSYTIALDAMRPHMIEGISSRAKEPSA